ncbi:MAG: putative transcriptional regulator [Actinomycetota bacterium]|nr:putative transcriptional regulator [Actinomycetota bacterium]
MPTVPLLLRGRLLVATPPLADPNFDRSVVLLLEHSDDGALGIVLNRPSETPLATVLPDWDEHATAPGVVFSGGPVAPEAVIALARGGTDPTDGWMPFLGEVGTVDVGRDPADLGPRLVALRIFVGYAGWSPGQLEVELEQEAWFVASADSGDPFSPNPQRLWRDVLRRQRGRVAMFANYPEDPDTN